jgi:hypothetical protein
LSTARADVLALMKERLAALIGELEPGVRLVNGFAVAP